MKGTLLFAVITVMMLAGCGLKKAKDLTRKMAEEAAKAAEEAVREAEEGAAGAVAGEEAPGEGEGEEYAFPAKGIATVEDALSEGDPMLGEETWNKIVKAGAELVPVAAEIEKATEGEGAPDGMPPTRERTLAAMNGAGFKDVEEFKEVGDKLKRIMILYEHLKGLEGIMAMSAELAKGLKEQAAVTALGGGDALKAARAAGQSQADYLKGELQGKAYTRKDVELYCRYKKAHSEEVDTFLGASLMADMLLAK